MIASSTTLGLNFLLSQWWDPDMFSNSYIKVSYAFTIIGLIAEPTLKFIDDTRCKSLGNTIFKTKSFCWFVLTLSKICNLQQLRMPLRDFFNLVLVCNNGPRQGRTKNKVFLCTVITFSLTLYLLSFKTIINKVLRIPVILEGLRPKFLDSKNRVREKVITVPKKTLLLVLPYLGPLSLQTRT